MSKAAKKCSICDLRDEGLLCPCPSCGTKVETCDDCYLDNDLCEDEIMCERCKTLKRCDECKLFRDKLRFFPNCDVFICEKCLSE